MKIAAKRYKTAIIKIAICTSNFANKPPTIAPKIIAATVKPSTHPLAATKYSFGNNSVNMPYLAGEYVAAPIPTIPYAYKGSIPKNIAKQPKSFIPFDKNMTCPLGLESAKAPTKGASNIYARTKN